MVTESHVRGWVDAYIKAWDTNQPDDITSLFTPDARYFTEPHAQPWEGHEGIVRGWLEHRDAPGQTSFEYRVIVSSQDLAIVKGEAVYKSPRKVYSNLWEIRFASDGKAREFVEWWMEQ